MKARKIHKLRIKILSKEFYEKRLRKFADMCEYWSKFYKFDCEKAFVGTEKAEYNYFIYKRKYSRASAQYKWYKKKLNLI